MLYPRVRFSSLTPDASVFKWLKSLDSKSSCRFILARLFESGPMRYNYRGLLKWVKRWHCYAIGRLNAPAREFEPLTLCSWMS